MPERDKVVWWMDQNYALNEWDKWYIKQLHDVITAREKAKAEYRTRLSADVKATIRQLKEGNIDRTGYVIYTKPVEIVRTPKWLSIVRKLTRLLGFREGRK